MLKIIGGQWGGRRLHSPPGRHTRPSAARLREALFAILQTRGLVLGARVLDVCAGSGALGLEALSRQAAFCLFVEKDQPTARLLKSNLAGLGAEALAQVHVGDFQSMTAGAFDLILADPPYQQGLAARIPLWAQQHGLLAPGGMLVVEHSPRETVPAPDGLKLADQRRYGQSLLSFFEN